MGKCEIKTLCKLKTGEKYCFIESRRFILRYTWSIGIDLGKVTCLLVYEERLHDKKMEDRLGVGVGVVGLSIKFYAKISTFLDI